MTGYGKAECMLADKKLTIEIKSLNSKQLDFSSRMPGRKGSFSELNRLILALKQSGPNVLNSAYQREI